MNNRYKAKIEISNVHHLMLSCADLEQHVKRRLAAEFLSILEQRMDIKYTTNPNRDSVSYEGGVVILSLDEYDKLRYNSVSSEDRFTLHTPKREPEFDAVNYLKNLMKKSR
jgi:hypothetical protein